MSKTRILNNGVLVESTLTLNPELIGTLEQVFLLVQERLRVFASDTGFSQNIALAFGEGIVTEPLQTAWLAGDVSNFPQIDIVSGTEINGARGAYAGATNRIYLSEQFLSVNKANPEAIASVLLEEYGHSVDAVLNSSDAPGDEGAIFSALVKGQVLSEEQIQQLKTTDDTATVTIDGQLVEIEQAVISGDGGQGGTTKTIPLESTPLTLVRYSWENYSIPDEFQILYDGKRIAGDVGLQSGGKSNEERIVLKKNSDELVVKVTAPLEGTAWNFNVETLPLEITIDGFLGDVIKVDLSKEFEKRGISLQDAGLDPNGFGIQSNSNNKGIIAEIDDWQTKLKKGEFYFVPTVNGTPRQLGQARSDTGIGESTLTITNGNIEIPVKFNITDSFSTSGDNRVTVGTQRLDIYRQEQRLSYLAFPQQSGNNLVVDGNDNDLSWAIQLFNIATSQRPLGLYAQGGRGRVTNYPSTLKESDINSSNVPQWTNLNGIQNFTFVITQRRFGTNNSASAIQGATNALGININSTGVTGRNGEGDPSKSHDGGRGVDIDTIPQEAYHAGANFFLERRINNVWYVAAPNNQIIVRNPNGTYQAAAPILPVPPTPGNPGNPGNLVNAVRGNQAFNNEQILNGISGFIQDNTAIGYNLNDIQTLIQSFQNTGLVGRVLYNDPRTWSGNVGYFAGHNGHVHFEITTPVLGASANRFNLQSPNLEAFSLESSLSRNTSPSISPLAAVLVSSDLSNPIELGQLEGNVNLAGSTSSLNPDIYYRFTLGNPIEEDEVYFFTMRDFSLLLNGLSADVDVELIQDFNGDNIRQDYEVVASSEEIGNSDETINLTDLSQNVYYVRVFQKSGDTNYNLSLSVPPLPVPPDNAGNTPSNAQDLGILSSSLTRTDFIGEVDPDDYYRFSLAALSDFSLEVSGLDQGDLVATLGQDINNDGVIDFDEIIAVSDAESNESEALNINGLAGGSYYVWLSRNSGNTDYNLNLSATPAIIPPDQAGSTPSTALNIGSLNSASNFSDFVGNVDPEDFYRFSLANVSGLRIELNGLAADADLKLAQDSNNDGRIDSNEIISTSELKGSDAEVIDIIALAAGTYYVRVDQYEGDTNYNLSLTPTNAVGSDLSVTRTDDTGAVNLGDQYTYTLTVTNNGPNTATDVVLTETLPGVKFVSATTTIPPQALNYLDLLKFQLNAGEQVTIDIDAKEFGSGLDSVLRLFDSSGNQVAVSDNNPAPGESFSTDSYIDFTASSAQTYYVGVSSYYDFYYDPFTGSPTGYGYTSGSYTLNVSIGSGNFSNQVTLSEPNDTIAQSFDTGLSSANPGTFVGLGLIQIPSINPVSVSNNIATANIGSLKSGESATINFTVNPIASGDILNTTNVTTSGYDYNSSNNSLVSTKTVNSITPDNADLELTQTVNNANPRIGDQVTFTLTLTNQGPGTATVIKVRDILPGELTYVSALADLGSYDSNTGIWTVGNMPPNENVSLRITANINSGQSITNSAEVIAVDEGDPDSTPNNNNPNEDDFTSVILDVVNEAPIAEANKTLTILEDAAPTSLNISVPTDANGDPLTITVERIPDATKGEIRLSNGIIQAGDTLTSQQLTNLVFVPVANANGAGGIFNYTVSDGQSGTTSQSVTLEITPVNDAPVATNDIATTDQNIPVTISVLTLLANDSDIDGNSLSITAVSDATNGSVVLNTEQGNIVFTPAFDFSGAASFNYTVSDGNGGTNTAAVAVTVNQTSSLNEITGTSGRDVITGTSSNDRIIGLQGADTITGGGGNDQFVYTNIRDRGDTITDFEVGKDNIVFTQLLDSLVTGGYNGANAIADGYVKVVQGTSASNFSVQIDADGPTGNDIFRPFITVNLAGTGTFNNPSNFVF
ncbi:Ig-like domain-containing protein [Nostoc sp. PA-18-2419]|uniref:Ig-like domain-containing protein n=1 Tax=Nostoc sp. PA-18-2419 TaxID=2575443 RepID=UPI0011088AEB|nr:cadherin-like domain-containing protein [Nostoc sp. PA-18-2419]